MCPKPTYKQLVDELDLLKQERINSISEKYLLALSEVSKLLLKGPTEIPFKEFVNIIGPASGSSRTYIFKRHEDSDGNILMSQMAEWCAKGINPEIDNPDLQNIPFEAIAPRWIEDFEKGESISGKIANFPESEREVLEPQGIISLFACPLKTKKSFYGFIGFDYCVSEIECSITERKYLSIAAQNLSQFIDRQKALEALKFDKKSFELTMDALDAPVYVSDLKTKEILFTNKLLRDLLGNSEGKKCYQALQGEDSECSFCTNHLLIGEDGTPNPPHIWEFQNQITNNWYQCRDQAIYWTDGRLVRLEIAIDITDRKLAEDELIESKKKLIESQKIAKMGHYSYNIVKDHCENSAELDSMFGIGKDYEKNLADWMQIVHPDFHEETSTLVIEEVIGKGNEFNHEFKVINQSTGEELWVHGLGYMTFDNQGNPIQVFGTIQDITERKNLQEAVYESEERYRGLSEAAFEAVFILEKGICIEQNLMASKMFGYTNEEAQGKNGIDWVTPKYQSIVINNIKNQYEKPYEVIAQRKDGTTFPAMIQGRMMRYKSRDVSVTALNDITDRKLAEKEMRKSELKLNEAQKMAQIGSWELNLESNVLHWSDEIYRIFEIEAKDFKATYEAFLEMIHPEDRDLVNRSYLESVDNKKPYSIVHRLLLKDGSEKFVHERGQTFYNDNGEAIRSTGTVQDITKRKQEELELVIAKEKAERSDQLKTVFLNNMSHEIRTPLNGILGFSDLLTMDNLTPEKIKHYTSIIHNSSQQLLRIIDDILEISVLETKQVKPNIASICLNNLFLELFSIFDIRAKETGISLYLDKGLSDQESTVFTDSFKLNKVLSNLLENAFKFTTIGSIEFGYKLEGAFIIIFVKDTGIGIDPSNLDMIFDRFSQANREVSVKVGGLGLGLSIAKENVQLLGGQISVESELGKGTLFEIKLPYSPIEPKNSLLGKGKDKADSIGRHKIIVAEDEEVNFLYIEVLLNTYGIKHKILHARNGEEVIKMVKESNDIDLILMDLKMPVMDGFTATKLVKKTNSDIPIIALTAYSTSIDIEKALSSGCDDFISKPINKAALKRVLETKLKS